MPDSQNTAGYPCDAARLAKMLKESVHKKSRAKNRGISLQVQNCNLITMIDVWIISKQHLRQICLNKNQNEIAMVDGHRDINYGYQLWSLLCHVHLNLKLVKGWSCRSHVLSMFWVISSPISSFWGLQVFYIWKLCAKKTAGQTF